MNEEPTGTLNSETPREERATGMTEDWARRRFAVMEDQLRTLRSRFRLLGFGLLVAIAACIILAVKPELLGLGDGTHAVGMVRTQHLVLEDRNGVVRGEWEVDGDGNARLSFLDREGRPRLSLSVLNGGWPGLSLIDSWGTRRAVLGILPDETTNLVLGDEAGKARAVLAYDRTLGAQLVFADRNEITRAALGVDASGQGMMMLVEDEETEDPGGGGS